MIRRPPRSTQSRSSAASDVYKRQVKGPGQVQNDIESSNISSPRFTLTLSQFLNNNRTQDSQINLGNLLTLPVGGGLLYVEPIYVSAKTTSSYPLARAIVVAFGNQLAWSDTLGAVSYTHLTLPTIY